MERMGCVSDYEEFENIYLKMSVLPISQFSPEVIWNDFKAGDYFIETRSVFMTATYKTSTIRVVQID